MVMYLSFPFPPNIRPFIVSKQKAITSSLVLLNCDKHSESENTDSLFHFRLDACDMGVELATHISSTGIGLVGVEGRLGQGHKLHDELSFVEVLLLYWCCLCSQ